MTEREKQVLLLMVKGKETDEIAELLHISKNTVAKHRSSLLRKLRVNNAVEMTRLAIRHGLIDP
ncbi:MAG: LuxR C-terminal-related transcriptional regulator [Desulfuromonadaceae bacterium]